MERIKKLRITKSKLGKERFWEWALAEVTVHLFQKEKRIMTLWPKAKVNLYPNIVKVQEKVASLWKKENFQDRLIKSYRLLKKNPLKGSISSN